MATFEKFENIDKMEYEGGGVSLENKETTTTMEKKTTNPPSPPPPLLQLKNCSFNTNGMTEDDWAMAYGLRRCRICGYNEGPLICPSNCYGVKQTTAAEPNNTEKK